MAVVYWYNTGENVIPAQGKPEGTKSELSLLKTLITKPEV